MKKNTIKRALAALIAAATIASPTAALAETYGPADIYPDTMIVTWADGEAGLMGLTDCHACRHYTIDTDESPVLDACDWQAGDLVSVIMKTQGTNKIDDDFPAIEYRFIYAGLLEDYAKIVGRYSRVNIRIVYMTPGVFWKTGAKGETRTSSIFKRKG